MNDPDKIEVGEKNRELSNDKYGNLGRIKRGLSFIKIRPRQFHG